MVESWWPAWPWQLHLPAVMHPGDRGQGLSPAVSTPIVFHGSSLISRICHCRGVFLLEGFNPCCHGSQAPSRPSWILCSLSFSLHVFPNSFPALCPALTVSFALRFMAFLSFCFCLSTVCVWVRVNLSGRVMKVGTGCIVAEQVRHLRGKRLLFVWTDAQAHLWTSVSDQRSRWCRTDSWAMSYQPTLQSSSIILSPCMSHSDDETLNKVHLSLPLPSLTRWPQTLRTWGLEVRSWGFGMY